MSLQNIKNIIQQNIDINKSIFINKLILTEINLIIDEIVYSLSNGGKILFCGNGGSASDAQHLSAELTGRFYKDRNALASEALHCNTSYITAVANDYSYNEIYARLIKGIGKKEDILIGLTTSGNSTNIINAFKVAQSIGIRTIAFTGLGGGEIKLYSDRIIEVPSKITPRIQESHILIGHIICEFVEEKMFIND